ncbi:hypothetical protein SMD44_08033 [Streptomyces alboflavus]|uniref:Alpha/beta hydrolase n=1 Tax=Streptomyces alboflavus TaxID=67267 RepID=A0A1Z1WQ45_9ACTN|nr:hypothetical protein [Streptomyces alboflavus]ARX88546.1 hypothetical protein SMD44_08033 [Streptomyces alboflavus]
MRAQTLATYAGKNPEQLVFTDQDVRSAGAIPVRLLQHGKRYLTSVPTYGQGLEEDWTKGQKEWQAVSRNSERSTARGSGHYIYVDEPEVAVEAIERVAARAAEQDAGRDAGRDAEDVTGRDTAKATGRAAD